jgi:hypothetical protein
MEFFKVLVAVLAIRGGWSLFASPSGADVYKINAYDSIAAVNTHLYAQVLKANTQISSINNNFLYQYYMKNVDLKDTLNQ